MTQRLPHIVGVGHVSVDHVFQVEAFPGPAAKAAARDYRLQVGGMTANAVVAAARLGARATLAAAVGDDGWFEVIRAHFLREGVEPAGLLVVERAHTSVAAVIVEAGGERLIVGRRGDAAERAPAARFEPAWLDGADALLTDPRCPPWSAQALRAAHARGVLSVFDGDVAPAADLRALAGLADWAVFSEPGLQAFAGPGATLHDALSGVLAAGAQQAVVTLGERGLAWLAPGATLRQWPALPVPAVVDTTGAGDVFHAALGFALAAGQAPPHALCFAAAAAALKCTRAGGALGAPTLEEVQALVAAVRPRWA